MKRSDIGDSGDTSKPCIGTFDLAVSRSFGGSFTAFRNLAVVDYTVWWSFGAFVSKLV